MERMRLLTNPRKETREVIIFVTVIVSFIALIVASVMAYYVSVTVPIERHLYETTCVQIDEEHLNVTIPGGIEPDWQVENSSSITYHYHFSDEINKLYICYYDMCLSFDGYTTHKVVTCTPEPETMKYESSVSRPRTPPAYLDPDLSTKYIIPLVIFGIISIPAVCICLYIYGSANSHY